MPQQAESQVKFSGHTRRQGREQQLSLGGKGLIINSYQKPNSQESNFKELIFTTVFLLLIWIWKRMDKRIFTFLSWLSTIDRDLGELTMVRILIFHWLLSVFPRSQMQLPERVGCPSHPFMVTRNCRGGKIPFPSTLLTSQLGLCNKRQINQRKAYKLI